MNVTNDKNSFLTSFLFYKRYFKHEERFNFIITLTKLHEPKLE